MLVDKYLTVGSEDGLGYDEGLGFYEEFDSYTSEKKVEFKVYRLDENAGKWMEVNNLGDRLLFIDDNYTFSAFEVKENCILVTDELVLCQEDD